MIHIDLDECALELSVKGHAEPEETEDYAAVCTAVSTLVQSLGYCLARYQAEKDALRGLDYRRDKGDLFLKPYPEDWARPGTKRRMSIYGDGLELLAMSHPESIEMVWDGKKIEPMKDKEGKDNE